MALMTSCPACVTRFKVVPDQLRLHHGLVRCGACDHVFDANKRLETLPENLDGQDTRFGHADRKSTRASEPENSDQSWVNKPAVQALANAQNSPAAPNTAILDTALGAVLSGNRGDNRGGQDLALRPKADTVFEAPEASLQHNVQTHSQTSPRSTPPQGGKIRAADPVYPAPFAATHTPWAPTKRGLPADAASSDAEQNSTVLRQFNTANHKHPPHTGRQAAAQRTRVDSETYSGLGLGLGLWLRTGLQVGSVLGVLLVFTQLLLMGRFYLADKVAAIKPVLTLICRPLACAVEPAKWLHPLNLDALTLTRLPSANNQSTTLMAYRLQATVRNASHLAVLSPNIELSISNSQGQLLSRKTLEATKLLGAAAPSTAAPLGIVTIAANGDWLIDTTLLLDEETVGYTARLVYL
jgi:predicted Zn finger-like uncharacterized protein